MLRRGVRPDAQTHNSLINAFVKAGELGKALQIVSSMGQRGVKPTLITYNTLLDGCARAGNLTLARQTLVDMRRAGLQPSERTYAIMIHLCARRGRVDAAFEWVRQMEERQITPNAVTYTALINCCGKAGQLERAFSLLAEMQSRSDTKPNVVTYTSLIDACAKARQPRRAVAVFRQMIEAGVAPNDITCHALFSGCLQQGEVLLAREVLQYMTSVGLRPTAHSFTALLADAASGSAAFACLLRQLMTGQLTGGTPLTDMPTEQQSAANAPADGATVLGPASADADVSGAAAAVRGVTDLERDLDADLELDLERAPQPFLADTAKPPAPELQRVFGIFGQMRSLGVPADRAAYNALINACARAGDLTRAEGAFGEMVAAGISPDAISFSSLIKACAVAGDATRAEEIWLEMQQRTNHVSTYTPPSSHTYAHLMAVHRRVGSTERVLELLGEMSEPGHDDLSPSVVHYSLALQACDRYKELPLSLRRAMRIYGSMREHNLRLDSRGMLALTHICDAHGREDIARTIRQQRSMLGRHGRRYAGWYSADGDA